MPIKMLQKRMNKLLDVSIPRPDDVRLLLIDSRIAIEHLGISKKYPTIGMYGNWSCHPELSQCPFYHDIVSGVQNAYEQCKAKERDEYKRLGIDLTSPEAKNTPISTEPMNQFFEDVIACFRHSELRNELLQFYGDYNIDNKIIKIDSNWNQFIFLVMHSIVDRPLVIPSFRRGKPHPTLEAMKKKAERVQLTPNKFYIEERHSDKNPNTAELYWVIEMIGPFKVTGLLMKANYINKQI